MYFQPASVAIYTTLWPFRPNTFICVPGYEISKTSAVVRPDCLYLPTLPRRKHNHGPLLRYPTCPPGKPARRIWISEVEVVILNQMGENRLDQGCAIEAAGTARSPHISIEDAKKTGKAGTLTKSVSPNPTYKTRHRRLSASMVWAALESRQRQPDRYRR